jgi:arylsulfatase A-like enzyme
VRPAEKSAAAWTSGPARKGERLVLFTSDHGEEFFDHGDFEHGHRLYQEVISVPAVLDTPLRESLRALGYLVDEPRPQ